MNDHEARRIAASVNMLRPDWPVASILTILDRPELATRPRRDVAVALTWVACESSTQTPARVLEAGPWWKATSVDGSSTLRERFDPRLVCAVCSEREETCRRLWRDDHDFLPVERRRTVAAAPRPDELRHLSTQHDTTPTPEAAR